MALFLVTKVIVDNPRSLGIPVGLFDSIDEAHEVAENEVDPDSYVEITAVQQVGRFDHDTLIQVTVFDIGEFTVSQGWVDVYKEG